MDPATHLDVPYPGAAGPRQALDLFLPASAGPDSTLLVYVHGGAWRSESKNDFALTLMPTLVRYTHLPVACLEYRLAPTDPHPAQVQDVVAGLSLLAGPLLPLEQGEAKWRRDRIVIVGHSAGAFMAASLVLDPPRPPPSPSFTVPPAIRLAIAGIICVDGIYDLPSLLDEYPSYASFVHDAFGSDPAALAHESPARWSAHDDERGRTVRVVVLHSRADELLTLRQPRVFVRRLRELFGRGPGEPSAAAADEKVGDEVELERELPSNVECDFDSLRTGHYEVVKGEELARAVRALEVHNW
ncbi:hypothetical protein JCM3775_000394 [Rhodotorula graminis]|uniref:Alpha/beta hydrolase fold-3 domain-containing protein n=1 Tax=Rhodotorula graminis (strain WP1) TaxID=578459 RepID=A0A194S9C3_RHOGW|nr:uncharacterized protein RHOBADRAFT_52127 [Rhodotorula graminis WP1]KPV77184.1 hypothetical protein RHOBADRAFT_52127 [Rhodotorula graminis WP1]